MYTHTVHLSLEWGEGSYPDVEVSLADVWLPWFWSVPGQQVLIHWGSWLMEGVIRVIFGVFSKGHVTLSYVPCLDERLCYLCMIDWDRNTWSDLAEVIGFNQSSSVSHVPYLDYDICQILEPLARAAAEAFFCFFAGCLVSAGSPQKGTNKKCMLSYTKNGVQFMLNIYVIRLLLLWSWLIKI